MRDESGSEVPSCLGRIAPNVGWYTNSSGVTGADKARALGGAPSIMCHLHQRLHLRYQMMPKAPYACGEASHFGLFYPNPPT
jgi:hypothetical protein